MPKSLALKVEALRKTYSLPEKKEIDVLRGIDLSVQVGHWVLLTGDSGCGKTTLLRIFGTLDKPDSGSIYCFGESVTRMTKSEQAKLRRLQIGFIFQSYHLFPELSALENVMLPGRLTGMELKPIKERATELMTEVRMQHRLSHRPAELSGGEQQRIAIARALMNHPNLILADEPTGNLDDKNSEEIMEILSKLRNEQNKTIVMVTHNPKLIQFADRSYSLEKGLLIEFGSQPA